jgi:hypothetical protein
MSETKQEEAWRAWAEMSKIIEPYEQIARELCLQFSRDPDKPFADDLLNWQYEAGELLMLRSRIAALRKAGFLGL